MKNVLMILYHYPPISSSGTQRGLRFAKYLPDFGYRPMILTTSAYGSEPRDRDNGVYRTSELYNLYRHMMTSNSDIPTVLRYRVRPGFQNLTLARIKEWASRNLLIPDSEIGWFPFAVWRGLRLIRENSIKVLLSSSPPESSHLIAFALHRLTKIPWVADLRDGWTFEPLRHPTRTKGFRWRAEKFLERRCLSHANMVITVSDAITEYIQTDCKPSRVVTIHNGFNVDDFSSIPRATPNKNFMSITHTGSFSHSRVTCDPQWFLRAVKEILDERKCVRDSLRIHFVGQLSADEMKLISDLGLNDVVVQHGFVPRKESIRMQAEADVLLLVTAPLHRSTATGKLFEYLYTRKPILALASDNTAFEIVKSLNAGVCVPPDDIGAIKRAIIQYYEQWQNGNCVSQLKEDKLLQYDGRNLTEELANVFTGIE